MTAQSNTRKFAKTSAAEKEIFRNMNRGAVGKYQQNTYILLHFL